MTDKEFIEMSRLLDSLTDGADTLRVVFETETVEDKDKAIRTGGEITTRVVSTERAKAHPDYKHRRTMPFDRDLETLASIIQKCDDWTTDKFKASEIYRRMRAFVSATSGMPKGISWPFKFIRSLCVKPMEMIPGRYPDLADLSARAGDECETIRKPSGKVSPSIREEITRKDAGATLAIKHGEKFTAQPNRQELAMCFNDEFRRPRPGETESRLDKLIHAMQATSFTRKDWGRVAYAIQANRRIRNDRIYRIGFSKWMVEFFSIIGVPCPSYLRIAEYKDQAGTRSFITNYLSV